MNQNRKAPQQEEKKMVEANQAKPTRKLDLFTVKSRIKSGPDVVVIPCC